MSFLIYLDWYIKEGDIAIIKAVTIAPVFPSCGFKYHRSQMQSMP
ncbi:MAG: hypothetical protein BWY84_00834 [Candidatus Aerophobetes bacterium ADurb.Bin490]|nr:MAG: hypothetical protein BWY84_00834 [Candidatus Aerophobetes bacterium ADurb.Bin490]